MTNIIKFPDVMIPSRKAQPEKWFNYELTYEDNSLNYHASLPAQSVDDLYRRIDLLKNAKITKITKITEL